MDMPEAGRLVNVYRHIGIYRASLMVPGKVHKQRFCEGAYRSAYSCRLFIVSLGPVTRTLSGRPLSPLASIRTRAERSSRGGLSYFLSLGSRVVPFLALLSAVSGCTVDFRNLALVSIFQIGQEACSTIITYGVAGESKSLESCL